MTNHSIIFRGGAVKTCIILDGTGKVVACGRSNRKGAALAKAIAKADNEAYIMRRIAMIREHQARTLATRTIRNLGRLSA